MPNPNAPDFDALLEGVSQVGGPRMKVPAILAALPDDQRPKVEAALRNPAISAARIAKALSKLDGDRYKVGEGAVAKWREHHGIG